MYDDDSDLEDLMADPNYPARPAHPPGLTPIINVVPRSSASSSSGTQPTYDQPNATDRPYQWTYSLGDQNRPIWRTDQQPQAPPRAKGYYRPPLIRLRTSLLALLSPTSPSPNELALHPPFDPLLALRFLLVPLRRDDNDGDGDNANNYSDYLWLRSLSHNDGDLLLL